MTAPVHVLLVEDHVQLRRIMAQALHGEGYRVTAAETADQALLLLESGAPPDILLSDIRMPGRLDGLQLAKWVQAHRPDVKILLQTGFTGADTGDFEVMRKPFNPDELFARLRAVLDAGHGIMSPAQGV